MSTARNRLFRDAATYRPPAAGPIAARACPPVLPPLGCAGQSWPRRQSYRAGGTMMAGSYRLARLTRRARGRSPRPPTRWLRTKIGLGLAALGCGALAACSSAGASTGPVTLNFYQFPDVSGATNTEINN